MHSVFVTSLFIEHEQIVSFNLLATLVQGFYRPTVLMTLMN